MQKKKEAYNFFIIHSKKNFQVECCKAYIQEFHKSKQTPYRKKEKKAYVVLGLLFYKTETFKTHLTG